MIVADTGPVYALIDRNDAWHMRVRRWWTAQPRAVVLPSTVLPEICHLLQTRVGALAEHAFVRSVADGEFVVEAIDDDDVARAEVLMLEYADLPLGFVDATVVAVAERLGAREILTTDRRHFGVVRPPHVVAFTLSP